MIILSFLLPITQNQHVDSILLPATFLFGTIYGFEIFIVLGNFSELKKLLAIETANFVFIFHISKGVNDEFAKIVEQLIEKYILTSIDYSLQLHVSSTNKDFLSIAEPIRKLEIKNDRQAVALESINKSFHKIVDARYQLAQVAPREIGIAEWAMLTILGFILIVILFLGRQQDMSSKIFSAIFSATVIGTLLLLDEADSNHIQETQLEYEIFNQVLRDIEKLPYYPSFALRKGLIKPKKGTVYRIGNFPNYPSLEPREIKLIDK